MTESDGYAVEIQGHHFDLTRTEGEVLLRSLGTQRAAHRANEEQALRDAGQVWHAIYWRHYSKDEEEFFSLDEAVGFLSHGEDYGELSAEAITTPEGRRIEGGELFSLLTAEHA